VFSLSSEKRGLSLIEKFLLQIQKLWKFLLQSHLKVVLMDHVIAYLTVLFYFSIRT
jgi:hypothetical protein